MPPLYLLLKPASGLCNLRCRYCFYHDEAGVRQKESYGIMQIEVLERIIEKALHMRPGRVRLLFRAANLRWRAWIFFVRPSPCRKNTRIKT